MEIFILLLIVGLALISALAIRSVQADVKRLRGEAGSYVEAYDGRATDIERLHGNLEEEVFCLKSTVEALGQKKRKTPPFKLVKRKKKKSGKKIKKSSSKR